MTIITRFLDLFYIESLHEIEPPPEKIIIESEKPQEQILETLDRLQLENDALQILSNKGVANAHIYIKMYSINDLLDIIKNN